MLRAVHGDKTRSAHLRLTVFTAYTYLYLKIQNHAKELKMQDGVIVLNKEQGITSQSAVRKVMKLTGAEKGGHTGTLDPMATGVLPVMLGRATKACEFLMDSKKHYLATMLLGITTDTEDVTGNVLTVCEKIPTECEVISAVDSMHGEIMQTPPMYSAIKIGGKKLVDMARNGITVDREPRKITVDSISAHKLTDSEYTLDVVCSKGTYIRTLCADIGNLLGCGAVMKTLCRLESAGLGIESAHTLPELEKMTPDELSECIIPVEKLFAKYREVILPPFFSRLAHNGLEIYLAKIGQFFDIGEILRISDGNGFFAIGEVRMYEDGAAVKPLRQFRNIH